MNLQQLTYDLARAWESVDATAPVHARYGKNGAGIGPYEEEPFLQLLHGELLRLFPDRYAARSALEVSYPASTETADLCLGQPDAWEWVVEVKYARMKRSDGRLEEAALSRVLSPYRESAVIDCQKLLRFSSAERRAMLIVGYDYPDLPLAPLIDDFESLARKRVVLGQRYSSQFAGASHPYHCRGTMLAWEGEALPG